MTRKRVLCLFDVDGTLTPARKKMEVDMHKTLMELKEKYYVAVVGGSDLEKVLEQIGEEAIHDYDYVFSQNGLVGFKEGKELEKNSFLKLIGEEKMSKLINFLLGYLSKIDIPQKRGNFIEFRTGMLNVSPIGRSCTYEERLAFNKLDGERKIREKLCKDLKEEFKDFNLKFSIGGQISIDIFPEGWDKTYCLGLMEKLGDKFNEIHFFGDKTMEGGNDYEIYEDERTIGHHVDQPEDTIKILREQFLS